MCVVSAIHNYGQSISPDSWTYPQLDVFKKLVKTAQEFDEVAEQPHCEDPEKTAFVERIEKMLADKLGKIEERLSKLEAPAITEWTPGLVQVAPLPAAPPNPMESWVLPLAGVAFPPTTSDGVARYIDGHPVFDDQGRLMPLSGYAYPSTTSDCVARYINGHPVFDDQGRLHGEPARFFTGGVVSADPTAPSILSAMPCILSRAGVSEALLHGARSYDPAKDYVPYRDGAVLEPRDPTRPHATPFPPTSEEFDLGGGLILQPYQALAAEPPNDEQLGLTTSPSVILAQMADRLREANAKRETMCAPDGLLADLPYEPAPAGPGVYDRKTRLPPMATQARDAHVEQQRAAQARLQEGDGFVTYSPVSTLKMGLADAPCRVLGAAKTQGWVPTGQSSTVTRFTEKGVSFERAEGIRTR